MAEYTNHLAGRSRSVYWLEPLELFGQTESQLENLSKSEADLKFCQETRLATLNYLIAGVVQW